MTGCSYDHMARNWRCSLRLSALAAITVLVSCCGSPILPAGSEVRTTLLYDVLRDGVMSVAILDLFIGLGRRPSGSTPPVSTAWRSRGTAGGRYHGVADEGVPIRDIAEIIGKRLSVPAVSKSAEEVAGRAGLHRPS